MKNYIIEYYEKIESGEINACKRIKQQYAKLVDDIKNPKSPYIFDLELANKPIEFIETFCCQAQGTKIGTPLKLQLFQKAKFQAIFGFVHEETKLRKYKSVTTIEGRKNGKTTENAALSLFMLIGDGEGSAECYFIATALKQAYKGFEEAYKMVTQSPMLTKHLKKRKSDLYYATTFSKLQPLASSTGSLDGLNSHYVCIDELAAIKDRDVFDLMVQSTSSREQALISSISTNGFVRDNIFDSEYQYACDVLDGKVPDEQHLSFIYELDHIDEWLDEDCWIKSNPGIDFIKKREELRRFVEKAKTDSSFKPTVLVKDFNMKQTNSLSWLSWETLNNEDTFDIVEMGFKYGILGFDKSETTDLTAATLLLMRPNDDTIYSHSMYWLPSMTLEERSKEDSVPYDLWERQGLLCTSGDYKINMNDVLKWAVEIREQYGIYILWCGYDPWHVDDSTLENFESEFGKNSMIVIRQGAVTLSEPMKNFEADLRAKLINYNNNNITKMCFANTQIKVDSNGNIAPVKGRDKRKRIDGTISHLCAYTILQDRKNDYMNMI